jgi:hypothetical protein
MGMLFKMLPSWVPLALGGLLIAGLIGGYFVWRGQQREIGRQEIIAKDAKALAEQKEKDAKLSADLVAELEQRLVNREATAVPVREVIRNVATECSRATGPDVDAAAQWVRDALSETGRPPAGRQPAR